MYVDLIFDSDRAAWKQEARCAVGEADRLELATNFLDRGQISSPCINFRLFKCVRKLNQAPVARVVPSNKENIDLRPRGPAVEIGSE